MQWNRAYIKYKNHNGVNHIDFLFVKNFWTICKLLEKSYVVVGSDGGVGVSVAGSSVGSRGGAASDSDQGSEYNLKKHKLTNPYQF